jgi:hypothetical protein
MRHLCTTTGYKLRKKIDNILYRFFPNSWVPLYTMVTFSRIRYSDVVKKREQQDRVNIFFTQHGIFFLPILCFFKDFKTIKLVISNLFGCFNWFLLKILPSRYQEFNTRVEFKKNSILN